MIGPAFFIGATLGGIIGYSTIYFIGGELSHIGFYALLGMGAMMGASLQAPLAALTAIMELTYNPGIIMPGMLTIVVAQLTASEIFKKPSLFISMLRSNGLDYEINPVMQVLRGIGVASVLNANVLRLSEDITLEEAKNLVVNNKIDWILLDDDDDQLRMMLPIAELAKYIQTDEMEAESPQYSFNAMKIPAKRFQLSPISLQANLQQAHEKFEQGEEALYVVFNEDQTDDKSRIYGVIVEEMLESAYKPKSSIKTK